MKQNQLNDESKIRRVLKNESLTVVWIVGLVFSVVNWIIIPQQRTATDVALINASIKKIEENHLTHLQNYTEEIKEIKESELKEQEEQTKLMAEIIKIQTKLGE